MSSIIKEISNLAKHSAVYGLSNVLGKAIGFLLIPLYTHYIPPTDYGTLELLDLSINIIGMFVGMGLASAVAKYYYDYDSKKDRNRVVSTALIVLTLLASGMIALCWPFSSLIADLVLDNSNLIGFVKISLVTFALNAILEIPLTYIRAREKSILFSIIALCRLTLSLALNIYFIVFLHLGISGILYSGLITSTLLSIVLLSWCVKDIGLCFSGELARKMIFFGSPLILNSFGMFIINFGDRFILKSTGTMADVGVYSLGYKLGMGLMSFLIGQPFFLIWSVRRYTLVKENNGIEKYGQIFLLYILILLMVWLFFSAFSKELIVLLAPPSYKSAQIIMPLIAFGYLFREMSDFFRGAFLIKSKTNLIAFLTIIVTIYCIINYLIFIPLYNATGAAIATVSTFIFMATINGYYAMKIMPADYKLGKITQLLIFYVIMVFVLYNIDVKSISALIIATKLIIILFCCFVSFFILFKKSERKTIISIAKQFATTKKASKNI